MARLRPTEHALTEREPTLAYGRMGQGPPLVLLHGLGARWQAFVPLMLRLREDFFMVAPDLRGHGLSGRTSGHYALPDFSADVARVIEATSSPPVALYGHSLGGWIALAVSADRPDLVHSVIVADTAIYPSSLDPGLAVSYLSHLPITLRSMAKSLDQLDPAALASFHDGKTLSGFQPQETLPRVSCPALLIQGDPQFDALMTDADVSRAQTLLPIVNHVRLHGIGHGLHVEDAGAVADAVTSFLEQSLTPGDGERAKA